MPMHRARWSYADRQVGRMIEVEVDVAVLEKLARPSSVDAIVPMAIEDNRPAIEAAARAIIDREGPNFHEPVHVTVADV